MIVYGDLGIWWILVCPLYWKKICRGEKSSRVLGLALTSQVCDWREDQMRSFTCYSVKEETTNQGSTGLQQILHATITAH